MNSMSNWRRITFAALVTGCVVAALPASVAAQTLPPMPPMPDLLAPQPGRTAATPGTAPKQGQMSDAEARMRIMLLQRSMQFGGIFRPAMDSWMKSPAADPCGSYSDAAARNACKGNDGWAADRLQQRRSTPSERAWWGG